MTALFFLRYNMKFDKTEPAVAESVLVSDDAPELLPASDSSVDGGDEEDRTKKISTSSAEEAAAVAAATKMSSARSETSTPPRSAEEGEEFEPVSRCDSLDETTVYDMSPAYIISFFYCIPGRRQPCQTSSTSTNLRRWSSSRSFRSWSRRTLPPPRPWGAEKAPNLGCQILTTTPLRSATKIMPKATENLPQFFRA